jgi:DNA-binding PadR family transcriptional regulator
MKRTGDYTSRLYWNGMIKMCLSRFFILRVLCEHPMHGYEIAKTVENLTQGCCSPTEGTLYPVLREFQSGGLVLAEEQSVGGRSRKVYTLTEKGREAFSVAVQAWNEVTRHIVQSARLADPSPKQ